MPSRTQCANAFQSLLKLGLACLSANHRYHRGGEGVTIKTKCRYAEDLSVAGIVRYYPLTEQSWMKLVTHDSKTRLTHPGGAIQILSSSVFKIYGELKTGVGMPAAAG